MARTNWVNGEEFDAGDLNQIGTDINGRSPTGHTHSAASIASGTIAIARIPTGTTSSTVCIGNDARLQDTAFIVHALVWTGTTWPDRPASWGPTLFIGGVAPTNAPADADVANGDIWITANGTVKVRTGGSWP